MMLQCGFVFTWTNRTWVWEKPLAKFKLHINTLQTASPCIVVSDYLFAKWILSTRSPWCHHTSWSLLGKNKWGEVGWWELAGFIMLMSVWHRQIYYIRKRLCFSFLSSVITLKQFSRIALTHSPQNMPHKFGTTCYWCWCHCVCRLLSPAAPPYQGKLDVVIAGIEYIFQLLHQQFNEADFSAWLDLEIFKRVNYLSEPVYH